MAEIITQIFNYFFGLELAANHWVGFTLAAMIHCVLLIHVPAVGALFFIWLERKIAGRIQDRLGPTRVGGMFGWLQTLADGLKLITKEDVMPGDADPVLFKFSPYIAFAASFAGLLALPFASGWVGQHLNHAAFFVLAVLGLEVFGVILAGYASGSKWSLFGGMREAAQVVSYEVPVGMCVLIPVMLAGTMNLTTIGDMQAGLFTNWFVFHDPFTLLIIFGVYFTCAMASVNRAPFDLAEAESELVAGFHTEYSGLRWSIFFMAEYGSMFIVSALAAILFLGGWHGPIPIGETIGNAVGGATAGVGNFVLGLFGGQLGVQPFMDAGWIAAYVANLMGCLNLLFKSCLGVIFMMWVRWTLPRLRIDQVITMCWKYCVPLAAIGFVGLLFWQYTQLWSPNDIAPPNGRSRGAVREHWARPMAVADPAAEESQQANRTTTDATALTPSSTLNSLAANALAGQVEETRSQ